MSGAGPRVLLARASFPARLLLRHAAEGAGFHGPRPKLFFIGFNKTGTKTLHAFFRDNGYLSVHSSSYMAHRLGLPPVARLMQDNRTAGRPLLHGLSHYDVFMDLIALTEAELIEANSWFRDFHTQHPDAFFVFNDRPVEKWVRSRLQHEGGPRGSFVKRYASATGTPESEVPDAWRAHYARHKAEVEQHFAGNPRFLVFNIETDSPERLVTLLAPHYRLDARLWSHHGSAEQRHRGLHGGE